MTKQSTSAASIIEGRPSLLDLAQPLIESAKPGEEVEIVLSRSGGVNIKAYRGEVESLTSAESFGVGVRVIVDGRVGFAHAGSHDPEVLAEVLADARDNVQFSERDVDQTLARPDGHPAIPQPQLWSEAVLEARAADKIALAIELEPRSRTVGANQHCCRPLESPLKVVGRGARSPSKRWRPTGPKPRLASAMPWVVIPGCSMSSRRPPMR